jgi:pyridoxal phosphate enzyme (YggS family)
MHELARQIAENVAQVRGRIARAAAKSDRPADDVTLVAVTKYVGASPIRALVDAGCSLLGESRPQQLWEKAGALADLPAHWHMIGQLQRNKVRRTLPLVSMVQSVDSLRLVEAMDRIAGELSLRMPVLLEVNVSGEAAKHGFDPGALDSVLDQLAQHANVEVRGLMCMAGLGGGPDSARRDFARLRALRDRLRSVCPEGVRLDELSMGMSGDYEVAVEEGATIVRIGSALFEGITA